MGGCIRHAIVILQLSRALHFSALVGTLVPFFLLFFSISSPIQRIPAFKGQQLRPYLLADAWVTDVHCGYLRARGWSALVRTLVPFYVVVTDATHFRSGAAVALLRDAPSIMTHVATLGK